ncbi:hypothetical protein J1N35_024606 [Gossypium stocksii]|uniref:Uncharacterized protein n=1 Tax=Gossypium stocksii TaxID=47602 RepID=A0A9D3V601_9ROSI|nr:hypothetical protein J1N35_024606 [Gossypium stocksii]
MVEFDLGQIIFDEIVKNAEKVHPRYQPPFSSLIFQVLHTKNPRIVPATTKFEKLVPQLRFSHKWLKGNTL